MRGHAQIVAAVSDMLECRDVPLRPNITQTETVWAMTAYSQAEFMPARLTAYLHPATVAPSVRLLIIGAFAALNSISPARLTPQAPGLATSQACLA